jgi:hypothetical protein
MLRVADLYAAPVAGFCSAVDKQTMARRSTPSNKAALKSSLTSYMRTLQRCPAKVHAFFKALQSDMLPEITILHICRSG